MSDATRTDLPRTAKGRKTRGRVLEAAETVFISDGYHDARMDDIAAAAGISKGALYRYFDNKDDVFSALIEDLHESIFRESGDLEASLGRDPYGAILAANRRHLARFYEHRHLMRCYLEAATAEPHFLAVWWSARERHVARFLAALRSHFGPEDIATPHPEGATEALYCMVEFSAYVWLGHEELLDAPVALEDAAVVLTRAWYATFFPGARP